MKIGKVQRPGECILPHGNVTASESDSPAYVSGVLAEGSQLVEILDLDKLASWEVSA